MKINHRIEFVTGPFETKTGKLVCVPNPKHCRVDLCFDEEMKIPFARIVLHSEDRYIDAKAVLEDAEALGKEIARRWNAFSSNDEVFVALKRHEGYEEVHPSLVAEDAINNNWTEYRVLQDDAEMTNPHATNKA